MSPMLYGWYRVLDKWMPGTSTMISIKKSVIDVLGCGIPYYSAFYCGKSFSMYVKKNILRILVHYPSSIL